MVQVNMNSSVGISGPYDNPQRLLWGFPIAVGVTKASSLRPWGGTLSHPCSRGLWQSVWG